MDTPEPTAGLRLTSVLPWFILMLIGFALFVYLERGRSQRIGPTHPMAGQRLSRLDLVPLTGNPPSFGLKDLPGRVTLLNFWGTWCPPCTREFPHLAALEKKYRTRDDFHFVSVSVPGGEEDQAGLAKATEAFLKAYDAADLPTYADADPMTALAFFEATRLEPAYPTTIIFDRQAVMRGIWQGYEPGYEHDMQQLVEQLLGEKTPATKP